MNVSNLIICLFSSLIITVSSNGLNGQTKNSELKTTEIDGRTWMSENLNISAFQNGDEIKQATTTEEWFHACREKQPVWCYFEFNPRNEKKYGKLYNGYAVNDARGLAMEGWEIPGNDEWISMINFLGGTEQACLKLQSKSGFKESAKGNNESGFNAIESGCLRDFGDKNFFQLAAWWTSTKANGINDILNKDEAVFVWLWTGKKYSIVKIDTATATNGMAVRCIKKKVSNKSTTLSNLPDPFPVENDIKIEKKVENRILNESQFCESVRDFLADMRKTNFTNYIAQKKDSFKAGDNYNYIYYSSKNFPGAVQTTIHEPLLKKTNPNHSIEIILNVMPSDNGKVSNTQFYLYRDYNGWLKNCLEPEGYKYRCHDMDSYRIYKYRTTLTFNPAEQNNSPFSNMQVNNNGILIEIYIDKTASDEVSPEYKLIMKFKVGGF